MIKQRKTMLLPLAVFAFKDLAIETGHETPKQITITASKNSATKPVLSMYAVYHNLRKGGSKKAAYNCILFELNRLKQRVTAPLILRGVTLPPWELPIRGALTLPSRAAYPLRLLALPTVRRAAYPLRRLALPTVRRRTPLSGRFSIKRGGGLSALSLPPMVGGNHGLERENSKALCKIDRELLNFL